jgi:hypothetical protein
LKKRGFEMCDDEYVNSAKKANKSEYYIDIHLTAKRNATCIGKIKRQISESAKKGMFQTLVKMNEEERLYFVKKGFEASWTPDGYILSWR